MWTGTNVFWLSIGCVMLGWGLHQYWLRFQRWRARRRLRKMFMANLPNIFAALNQGLVVMHELLQEEDSESVAAVRKLKHHHQEHDDHGSTH